jgi:hypothetical protein
MPMKTRRHFTFRVDTWTPDGECYEAHEIEHVPYRLFPTLSAAPRAQASAREDRGKAVIVKRVFGRSRHRQITGALARV